MLCPEVWKFSPPSYLWQVDSGNLNTSSKKPNYIEKHYFNHLVSVVLPGPSSVSELTTALIDNSEYYKVHIPIHEFVNIDFIEGFVKKGKFYAVSINTKLDTDECFAVTPCGKLILSLNKETFQELGIEGKPSFFSRKNINRYVVQIDLLADAFKPGKKNYDRVKQCLKKNLKSLDCIFSWYPHNNSVVNYFQQLKYKIFICKVKVTNRCDYNVNVPLIGPESDVNYCSPNELKEWLGAFSIGVNCKSKCDGYVSTYYTPGTCANCSEVTMIKWQGLFTPHQIERLFETLRNYVKNHESLPWVSLHVQGFADVPVSWGLQEHEFYINGDNSYTIFIQPNDNFLSYKLLSSIKPHK